MKPIALEVTAQLVNAKISYGGLVAQEHIQSVINDRDYLNNNREVIIQDFLALAVLDCTNAIAKDVQARFIDGTAPHTPN